VCGNDVDENPRLNLFPVFIAETLISISATYWFFSSNDSQCECHVKRVKTF